jgi:hypothetical protein
MVDMICEILLNFFCVQRRKVGNSGIFLKLVHVLLLVAVAVRSDPSGSEIIS